MAWDVVKQRDTFTFTLRYLVKYELDLTGSGKCQWQTLCKHHNETWACMKGVEIS
jgi:hypothetical protein